MKKRNRQSFSDESFFAPILGDMPTLAENVSKLMADKGLSEPALARLVGVSQPTIHGIVTGKQLTTKALPRLAAALGVSPGDLDPEFGRSGGAPLFGINASAA